MRTAIVVGGISRSGIAQALFWHDRSVPCGAAPGRTVVCCLESAETAVGSRAHELRSSAPRDTAEVEVDVDVTTVRADTS
jgi:hypothetical protein